MYSKQSPLVSFIVVAYNQEQFIREAVEGAFSQIYSPLEIILSDDCSSDRTFKIMQEMVLAYQGPHRVVLNHNAKNMGLGAHVNLVMDMAQGELCIGAAGDDISLPERTACLTMTWLSKGRPSGIASGVILIDEQGKCLGEKSGGPLADNYEDKLYSPAELANRFIEGKQIWLLGCSAAWSKLDWNLFGKMCNEIKNEDAVLSFRGCLRSGLCVIKQTLVKYRTHRNNISFIDTPVRLTLEHFKSQAMQSAQASKWLYAVGLSYQADLVVAEQKLDVNPRLLKNLKSAVDSRLAMHIMRQRWWELGVFPRLRHWKCSPCVSNRQLLFSLFGIEVFSLYMFATYRIKNFLRAKAERILKIAEDSVRLTT